MFRCLMKTGLICFSWLYMAVFPLLCQEETGSADYEGEGLSFWLAAPEDYLKQKKSAPYHVARMKKSGEDTPFDVTVITDQDMEVLPVRNASEALNLLSSVTMSYGGEFIQACIPTVLGSDLTHTKVVMDGIELNTQLDGTADLSAYGFDQVQKFEIVTGPLSSLWGSSLGGVIYLKTKNPSVEPSLTVRSSYGSYQTLRTSLDASFHLGKLGCLFIPQYTETEGYMDGGRSKRMCTFFKGRYEMKEISMELISGYSDFDIGEYEQKRFFIRTELDGHDFYSGLKINSDALFSNQDLAGSLFINGIKNKGQRRYYLLDEADTLHDVTNASESRVGIRADLFYQFNDNAMTIEVNHDQSVLESSNFDGEMKVRRSWFSIQDEYEFSKKVSAEVQGRYDSNSAFSDEGSFGAGIMLKGVKGWNIRQFFSRDFNAPPLAEKFMDRPELGLKSNESLSAETGYTWQMSLEKSFFEKWLAQIKTYIQKLQDGIIVSMDEEGFFYYDNADSIKRQGVEVNLTWMPFEKTLLKAGAAFNDVKNEDTDETVSGRERLKYTFDLEQKLPQNCTFTMTGYYLWWNMEEIYHSKERNFLFNAKYSWQPKKSFSLYGAVYNLFDTELYWIDVYPNPERSYEAGFEYQF